MGGAPSGNGVSDSSSCPLTPLLADASRARLRACQRSNRSGDVGSLTGSIGATAAASAKTPTPELASTSTTVAIERSENWLRTT